MIDAAPPPYTRRSPEAWAAARADYEAGSPAAVVAERHGLSVRSVRRHALREAWRREDPSSLYARRLEGLRSDFGGRAELATIDDLNGEDAYELLFVPSADGLAGYAFRRAAESAVVGGAAEAAAWLRVVRLAERISSTHDVCRDPFTRADRVRAAMLRIPDAAGDEAVDDPADLADLADVAAENRGRCEPGD